MGSAGITEGGWTLLLLTAVCCGGMTDRDSRIDAETGGTSGGAAATGGAASTGGTMGGVESAGGTTGGAPSGGTSTGGIATGGSTGGTLTGGLAAGGVATGGAATGGLATGGAPTGGVATGGMTTGGVATGGEGGRTPSCADLAAVLAERLPVDRVATIVVRLDYGDLSLLGYQILPGDPVASEPTEEEARAAVLEELGWGDELGPLMTQPAEQRYFAFYDRGDDSGTVAVVSADTGQVVFGAEVLSEARGEIALPATWLPAAELGDCPTDGPGPSSTWLPTEMFSFPTSAVERVWDTALPEAMELAVGGVNQKYLALLLYPRTYGGAADQELEYVVFWFYDYV